MQNKLKGTNCRKIFQDYFTGRLDNYIRLSKSNIDSGRCTGVYLSTYKHLYLIMVKQREALIKAYEELNDQEQTVVSQSFNQEPKTAETIAYEQDITVKNVRKVITRFKSLYAEHGGTDETEKELLKPIRDEIKAERRNEHKSN
ncbi:hypothetical protein [Weissella viridescens]|uniref:hypothetical protein n=1 Tax=Weissella viridescens TaxID=1629 RepID=UPI003AF2BA97